MSTGTSTLRSMDCSEFERSVDAFIDGEFESREQAEAEVHISCCPPCQALAASQRQVRAALRSALREAMGPASRAGRAPAALR